MLSLVHADETASLQAEERASRGIAVWSAREDACAWLAATLGPLGYQIHRDLSRGDNVAVFFFDRAGDEVPTQLIKARARQAQPMIVITSDNEARLVALSLGVADVISLPAEVMELTLRVERLVHVECDRKRVRRSIEAEQRIRHAKEEQATLLIHDLKNPISTILANVEFAREALREPPLADEALEDAGVGCRRALRLLGNLLDVARDDAGRFRVQRQQLQVAPMIAEIAHELEVRVRGRCIAIVIDVPPLLELEADLELLRRAVENILDNAIRYVPDGGEVAIAVRRLANGAEIRVGNSGPAIAAADRQRIFEKYERGHDGGHVNLGLGLYFCRLVAVAHGGSITVESARLPTEFVFFLPDLP